MGKSFALALMFVSSFVSLNALAEELILTREKISEVEMPTAKVPYFLDRGAMEIIDPGVGLGQVEVIVDKVINIGKKIWDVVEKGKPVVNQTYNVAHALPDQLRWTQLETWKAPKAATYRITYKNTYGMTVIDFTYRVTYVYGGSYQGVGRYLTAIRVQPANLNVAWGYQFDVSAEIPEVYNMGTSADPLAAANLIVRWTVKNSVLNNTQSDQYVIDGTGQIQALR